MDFGTHSKKRTLSATEPTSSPSRKRARASPTNLSKPILRVDCTVPPRPKPQFLSPLPFSIDSSATFTSSAQSTHSSARFYQHQSSSQVYDRHQTYNCQPQSYQQPPCRSPQAPYWNIFPGFQPAWTPSFADMCQTSVSCSIYSGFPNTSEHVGDFASTTRTSGPTVLPNQSGDARDTFINAILSRLHEMEDTLVAQQGFIKEILQMAALLGNHQ